MDHLSSSVNVVNKCGYVCIYLRMFIDKVVTFVYDHLFFSMPFHMYNIYIDNHRTIFIFFFFSFQLPVVIERFAVILFIDVYDIKI